MGFNKVNIFAAMPQYILHQDHNGLGGVHLLGSIHAELDYTLDSAQALRTKGHIKERLMFVRQLHDTNIPSEGLETEKLTAKASCSDRSALSCRSCCHYPR